MIKKSLTLSYLLLITLVALGGWLWSGSFSNPDNTSGFTLLLMLAGFIITMGACARIVILINRDIPLMNDEQAIAWEQIRVKGKNQYIRGYVIRGLLMFVALCSYDLIKYYRTEVSQRSATVLFGVIATFLIILVIFPFFWGIRKWNFKEKDYEILLRRKAQHNKSLDASPQSES